MKFDTISNKCKVGLWMLVFLNILLAPNLYANFNAKRLLADFDSYYYKHENFGLKDLVVDVKIANLASLLKEQLPMVNAKKIYFKLYWIFPGKYKIEVFNLPKSLGKVRSALKGLLESRMSYIIPNTPSEKLSGYDIVTHSLPTGVRIRAVDQTRARGMAEMNYDFTVNGKLTSISNAAGTYRVDVDMESMPWSKNKYVVTKINELKKMRGLILSNTQKIDYTNLFGLGLVKSIDVKAVASRVVRNKNGKKVDKKRKVQTTFEFSNYAINTGKAFNKLGKKNK